MNTLPGPPERLLEIALAAAEARAAKADSTSLDFREEAIVAIGVEAVLEELRRYMKTELAQMPGDGTNPYTAGRRHTYSEILDLINGSSK